MNNERRKSIRQLCEQLDDLKEQVDALREEEEDAFENMPWSLQESERGEVSQAATSALDSAIDSLEEAIGQLKEATGDE